MAHEAPLSGRTQSAAQLKGHNKSEVQLKERSQSAVAAAHMLDNKMALKSMTQHHQDECQRKLYDRCARGDTVLSIPELKAVPQVLEFCVFFRSGLKIIEEQSNHTGLQTISDKDYAGPFSVRRPLIWKIL